MLVHRRVTPSIKFTGTHLYSWVERGTVGVKCLAQEHNTMSLARARTRTARSGDKRTNHEATAPPYFWHRRSSNYSDMFADSSGKFQVKVPFNLSNGWEKGQAQSIHIFEIVLHWFCWPSVFKQRNHWHSYIWVGGEKLYQKNLISSTLS